MYPYPIVIHPNPPTSSTLHKLPFPSSPIDSKGFYQPCKFTYAKNALAWAPFSLSH